jgi:hypothetical protein
MKRLALLTSAVTALLSAVLLARAARHGNATVATGPVTAAQAAVLDGSAGWHYRHSQPTHWRSCMLKH